MDRVAVRSHEYEVAPASEELWTPDRLRAHAQRLFGTNKICVIANREPYIHNRRGRTIEMSSPASGLVTAIEPLLSACSGMWIAHGSGSADSDVTNARGLIAVPPHNPQYTLKRVWLTRQEEQGYYYGFANEGLWPLCHIAYTRPTFRLDDWNHYKQVNEKFADAFVQEMLEPTSVALVQDYHYALLPGMLRERRPESVINLFWHIPWPNPEVFHICPWRKELLHGMLAADLIGFHTQYHCNNFLDTVDRFLEARVDRETFSVDIAGHTCHVRPFPISVEWPPKHDIPPQLVPEARAQIVEELNIDPNSLIGLGVDRLDYTKGLTERFLAVERLLDKHPDLVGRFVFVQIASPSRTKIKKYGELSTELTELADRINNRFHRAGYQPIITKFSTHTQAETFRHYRAADVCVVTSLHDGMNLVAKEFVASRSDLGGSLVLSAFTGAARELLNAYLVNPYDIEETSDAIHRALTSDPQERRERMSRMRDLVASNNVYTWAGRLLSEIHKIIAQRAPLAMGTTG